VTDGPASISELLANWKAGDEGALRRPFPLICKELRRLVSNYLRNSHPGYTLKPLWGNHCRGKIKRFGVELWLRQLDLALKTKRHLQILLRVLVNCAMRSKRIAVGHSELPRAARMRCRLGILFIVLAFGVSGQAQTFRGAINGRVTDPSEGVVPSATVVAENVATGILHTTVTTANGQFVFQDLPLGTYRLTVTASAFAVFTADNITVTAGTIYTLPVRLTLAQASTTVSVSAAFLALDTTAETQTMTVAQSGNRCSPKRQAYQPKAIDCGHDVVDSVPKRQC